MAFRRQGFGGEPSSRGVAGLRALGIRVAKLEAPKKSLHLLSSSSFLGMGCRNPSVAILLTKAFFGPDDYVSWS